MSERYNESVILWERDIMRERYNEREI
jgi:hypothetical protein